MDAVTYLAGANFVVALGYYLIIVIIWVAPIAVPWLRRLGKWGLALVFFLTSFFFGCGTHHLDVATYFWSAISPAGPHASLGSLVVWETMQIVGAFGAAAILVLKGDYLVKQLQNPLRDVQP